MLDNDYPLGFKVALHRKDLGIALELAEQLGAVLPVSALAAQLETGLSPAATATTTCPPWPGRSGRRSALEARPASRRPRAVPSRRPTSSIGSPELAVVARPEPLGVVHRRRRPPARPEARDRAGGVWAYLPSWIATIRPVTPPSTRSIATFANVVATIESSESGSPLRRS